MSHVLLLRGVNVGGKGKLPMVSLCDILSDLGARKVQSYIQSGNVVLQDPPGSEEIATEIERRYGFRPACLLLPASDLHAAIAADPFAEAQQTPKQLHYFFCMRQPAAEQSAVEAALDNGERAELKGQVLYFHAPKGLGRSKFPGKIERLLGTAVTARNFSTVSRLAEMLDDN